MQFGLIYVFLKQDAGVPGWHPVLFVFGNTFHRGGARKVDALDGSQK